MSILFFTIIKVKRIIVVIIIHSGGTHFVVVHVSVVVRVVVLGFRIRVVKIAARLPPHHNISLETFASMTKLSSPKKVSKIGVLRYNEDDKNEHVDSHVFFFSHAQRHRGKSDFEREE
tara:strand:- start:5879 stop:6232 length:354 start_codon:yes stop_codon:yes gene_type:complete